MSPRVCVSFLLGFALLPCSRVSVAQESQAPRNDLSLGGYFSSGDYGQGTDTDIVYFPVSIQRSMGNWRVQASVPYLEIAGNGNVLVNVGGVGRSENTGLASTQTQRGVGDSVLTGTYQLPSFSETAPFFDFSIEVKIPTADERKGLGTGATDLGMQLDLYKQVGGTTLFGTVGYKFRGDSSQFSNMKNSGFVSLGFSRPVSERLSAGVIYDFREAASRYSGETHELLPYLSWSLSAQWTLMGYAIKGATQDSADMAVGAQLSYRW